MKYPEQANLQGQTVDQRLLGAKRREQWIVITKWLQIFCLGWRKHFGNRDDACTTLWMYLTSLHRTLKTGKLPSGLVGRIPGCHCRGPCSTALQGTEILQAKWHGAAKNKRLKWPKPKSIKLVEENRAWASGHWLRGRDAKSTGNKSTHERDSTKGHNGAKGMGWSVCEPCTSVKG